MAGAVSLNNYAVYDQAWSGQTLISSNAGAVIIINLRVVASATRYQADLGEIEDDALWVGFQGYPEGSTPPLINPADGFPDAVAAGRLRTTGVTALADPGSGPPSPWTRVEGEWTLSCAAPVGAGNSLWFFWAAQNQDSAHVMPVVAAEWEMYGWSA